MKILVTGAAGLVGSHLCDSLLAQGHTVIGIDNLSYGNKGNLPKSMQLIEDDVQNINTYHTEKFDIIYHLASMKKPVEGSVKSSYVMSQNIAMVEAVVEKCKKDNTYLIFTSTSDVYGNSSTFLESEPITIGPPTNERYSYAMSKLYGEQFILNEVNQSNLNASIVRIFASSRSNKSWSGGHVPLFADKASKGEDIYIHGDGLQTRSIGHAIDIADGLALIVSNLLECKGEIINLGTDEQSTVKYVAEYIVSRLDSKSEVIYTPREEVFGDYREILIRFADTTKAKNLLGFSINYKTKDVLDEIINNVVIV